MGCVCGGVTLFPPPLPPPSQAMPSVMEKPSGILSRSRAKSVAAGGGPPASEDEGSEDEHAHGESVCPPSTSKHACVPPPHLPTHACPPLCPPKTRLRVCPPPAPRHTRVPGRHAHPTCVCVWGCAHVTPRVGGLYFWGGGGDDTRGH